jgi:signal transduction histidine kinase
MDEARASRRCVTIRTRAVDGGVEVSVVDTGPGLPADPGLKIFEPFATTKAQGLGLGLAISQSLVEAHGGRLQARSNPEGGATFCFVLPCVGLGVEQESVNRL